MRSKFLQIYNLICFISISKFSSFQNPFATITSLSESFLDAEDSLLLVQNTRMISISYGRSTACWKPWQCMRLDLIFTMRDIYSSNLDSLTKFSTSSRSTQDILPWIIFQMILTTITISTRIIISCSMKRSIFKKSGCLVGLIGHVKLVFCLAQTHVFKKTWRMCLFYSILAHWCILFWLFCLFKNHFCFISHSFLTYFLYNLNK